MTTPDLPGLGAADQPYTTSLTVRWADLDGNGHVANSKYLDYATQARFEFLADNGFTFGDARTKRIGPVVLSDFIEYRRELRMGAAATVDLALSGARRDGSRWQFTQTIRTGDHLVATVTSIGAWLSLTERRLIQPPQRACRDHPEHATHREIPVARPGRVLSSGRGSRPRTLTGAHNHPVRLAPHRARQAGATMPSWPHAPPPRTAAGSGPAPAADDIPG